MSRPGSLSSYRPSAASRTHPALKSSRMLLRTRKRGSPAAEAIASTASPPPWRDARTCRAVGVGLPSAVVHGMAAHTFFLAKYQSL